MNFARGSQTVFHNRDGRHIQKVSDVTLESIWKHGRKKCQDKQFTWIMAPSSHAVSSAHQHIFTSVINFQKEQDTTEAEMRMLIP